MDPGVCRERLAELLDEEITQLTQLHTLLEQERGLIGAAEIESLQRTTRERAHALAALARIEEQRRSLCSVHGHGADRAGLEALLRWCDPAGTLAARLTECVKRAHACRELNDYNGLMVAARMKRVAELLQSLTGRSARADTYGPRGYAGRTAGARNLGSV
jgi:flagellar biosynthesis protein FlgN